MKARDVLAEVFGHDYGFVESTENADIAVDALLATTPDGEGVYIAPDGTLMRADLTVQRLWRGQLDSLYRLVPIEGGDRA